MRASSQRAFDRLPVEKPTVHVLAAVPKKGAIWNRQPPHVWALADVCQSTTMEHTKIQLIM